MAMKKAEPAELVEIVRHRAVTTSLKVAEVFGKEHAKVIRDIEKILADCAEMASERQTPILADGVRTPNANFGQTPYFHKTTYQAEEGGRNYPMYEMDFNAFTLLAMGFTGKKALQFKLAYIDAFNQMAEVINNWKNPEWQAARKEVKVQYRKLTDAIKECIIPLARAKGSTTPDDVFYTNWSKMLNKIGCYKPGSRDKLSFGQQCILHLLENLAVTQIRGLAALKILDDSAIYRQAKIKLNNFAKIAMINERYGANLLEG